MMMRVLQVSISNGGKKGMMKMEFSRLMAFLATVTLAMVGPAFGQSPFGEGSLVREHCGACHKPDQQGRIEVIEETRKTPEEWKNVLIRMTRLNDAVLEDDKFLPVVKELSRHLSLTPTETVKVAYINSDENSQYREIPKSKLEERLYTACVRCHTYGKIASHRMTESQWNENRNLHLGYYPTAVPQMREMDWTQESKDLIPELAKLFPHKTPEWQEWMKSRKKQDLSGKWRMAGYQPGMGYYEGFYEFSPAPEKGEDEYTIRKQIRYLNGTTLVQTGTGTLFAEFHLRYALAPTPLTGRIEGVFDLDAENMRFNGKWWTVIQDTNAFGNEAFVKKEGVLAAFPMALKIGQEEQRLTIVGSGFSEDISPKDIRFSDPHVNVSEIIEANVDKLVCKIKIGGEKTRSTAVMIKGEKIEDPFTLYTQVDGIRVLPSIGRARVSCGAAYPPQGVQFVARAVQFGPDGKAGTADDILLEQVDADWALEEEKTREGDDDLKYLHTSIENGLYTPVTTYGPIAERKQHREGVGLIAVTASVTIDGKILSDRARLAVTEPDFITHIK